MRWTEPLLASALIVNAVACDDGGSKRAGDDDDGGGSGLSQTVCQAFVECEGGNSLDLGACVAQQKGYGRHAALVGCNPKYEEWLTCTRDNATCVNGSYETGSCADGYVACVNGATTAKEPPSASSTAETYCAYLAECHGSSELDLYVCMIQVDTTAEVAAAYMCSSEFQAVAACAIDDGVCLDGFYDTSACESQSELYSACIAAASAL